MIKNSHKLFVISVLFILAACGSESKEESKTKVEAEIENQFNSDEYDFVLPQPISLAKAFEAAGLSYFPGLTNPADKEKTYVEKVKQLLNLGVYSTDLAYCALNEKAQEARTYLNCIQNLGNQVGLKPVFSDQKLIDKFDNSLNNMEAIEDLIYDIQERSEEYIQDNDIRYLSIVQFSGAWTEGMYLGIRDVEMRKGGNDLMVPTIVDQINLLKNIIKGIETYPTNDPILSQVNKKLEDVLSTYNDFESVKKAAAEESFTSPELSVEEFRKLSAKIKDLRTFIIQ